MARVLPSHPLPGLSKAVVQLVRACRRQLPEDAVVRVILTPEAGGDHPHLLLERPGTLLGVWVWEHPAEQLRPWLTGERELGIEGVEDQERLNQARARVEASGIPRHIAFRHLAWNGAGAELWRDPTPLLDLLRPVDESTRDRILGRFCPEIRVPPALTVREAETTLGARHTGFLLDATQEDAVKRDLLLPARQQQVASEFRAQIVTGVAGSGKSLILLYRLRLLRTHFPRRCRRVLVLTHNKALARDLAHRYQLLHPNNADGVEISTFMRWFGRRPESGRWREPIPDPVRLERLREAHQRHLADTAVTMDQLGQEIGWLKDQGLPAREDYLSLARSGQGFSLQPGQRERVYDAMEDYETALRSAGERDWHDVPLELWRTLDRGRRPLRDVYDAVFVDEAQFCAPIWFDLLRAGLDPARGLLFMAADPTQGFLRRRQSWRGLGFEVRGRVVRLDRSYRTTREILGFATMFYRRRQPDDAEALLATDLGHLPKGPLPILLPVRSPHDEITKVANEIEAYFSRGGRGAEVLVIHCASQGARSTLRRLQQRLGPDRAADPRSPDAPPQAVRVLSLDAATGLESRVVFLLGAHGLYEREQALRLSEEERADRIRQNTKRLYTAITRAGHALFITYRGPIPEDFLHR